MIVGAERGTVEQQQGLVRFGNGAKQILTNDENKLEIHEKSKVLALAHIASGR